MVCTLLLLGHTGSCHAHPLFLFLLLPSSSQLSLRLSELWQRGTRSKPTHPSQPSSTPSMAPLGTKLLSLQHASHADRGQWERRETEGSKDMVSRTTNVHTSHLLVLSSSVSSVKLQALPGDPLILLVSHKLSRFYHTARCSTLISMGSYKGCEWLGEARNLALLFTFPQLLPCTVDHQMR